MTDAAPPSGEIAVLGLGKSGTAVTRLLLSEGQRVYASDSGASSAASDNAEKLKALGADAASGAHDLERIARASMVVVSPGIPPEDRKSTRLNSSHGYSS